MEKFHEVISIDGVERIVPLAEFSSRCTVTATLCGFSTCSNDALSVYKCDDDTFRKFFDVKFYANGSCSEHEGYVSIKFCRTGSYSGYVPKEFLFIASVTDVFGNMRFSQTFLLVSDNYSPQDAKSGLEWGFDKYVKRSVLLSDSSELLPDDSLTLSLDIKYKLKRSGLNHRRCHHCEHKKDERQGNYVLNLDTEFGRALYKLSIVFRNMMDYIPGGSNQVSVPIKEDQFFDIIFFILKGDCLDFRNLAQIYDFYWFADKYDMPKMIQTCREWLISILRTINSKDVLDYVREDMTLISELAEIFEDTKLREILAFYSDIKRKIEGNAEEVKVSNIKLETEWICEYKGQVNDKLTFVLSEIKHEPSQMEIYR